MLQQPDISALTYPRKNYKVDPLRGTMEGFGRYVIFKFDILAYLLSAYLRGALSVGIYMCRVI